jgi:hypothetical protein
MLRPRMGFGVDFRLNVSDVIAQVEIADVIAPKETGPEDRGIAQRMHMCVLHAFLQCEPANSLAKLGETDADGRGGLGE